MTDPSDSSPPCDVHLLLRAHAQQHWLSREVVPVLRDLEQPDSLPEEQLGAALAYLEVLWIDASRRAAETDAASAELDAASTNGGGALHAEVRRYHDAVRTLHDCIAGRVAKRLAGPGDSFTCPPTSDRHASL
jgi:hypothetical protein